jgi:outer membrane receptor protein involved in Fe transport
MADATVNVSFFKQKLQLLGAVKNIFNVTNLNFSGPAGGVHNQGNGITPMAMGRYFGLGIKIIPFKS